MQDLTRPTTPTAFAAMADAEIHSRLCFLCLLAKAFGVRSCKVSGATFNGFVGLVRFKR